MKKPIVIFDGACALCNGIVRILLDRIPAGTLSFVPYQSAKGQKLLRLLGFNTGRLDTVIVIDGDQIYTHSKGITFLLSRVKRWRFVLPFLWLVPLKLRDWLYKIAASNRLAWFGYSQSCSIGF